MLIISVWVYGDFINTFFINHSGNINSSIYDDWHRGICPEKEATANIKGFVEDLSQTHVTGISALEVMGAMGVILPWATGVSPLSTPLAAVELGHNMIGAFLKHVGEKN